MNFYMFIYKVFIKKTLFQLKSLFLIFFLSSVLILSTAISASTGPLGKTAGAEKNGATANNPYVGVNMRGFYTSMSQSKNYSNFPPNNYFEDSFKLISQAGNESCTLRIQLGGLRKGSGFFHEGISDCGRYC